MNIVIDTPLGQVRSSYQSQSIQEVESFITSLLGKCAYLTVFTDEGSVILPEAILCNSIIRLVE